MKWSATVLAILVVASACTDEPTTIEPIIAQAPTSGSSGLSAILEEGSTGIGGGEDGTSEDGTGDDDNSSAPVCTVPPIPSAANYRLNADVTYNVVGGQQLRLDIARPRTVTSPRPLVIFIHGGGWDAGSKQGHRDNILRLTQLGYIAASVDYRLATTSGNRFPTAMQDIRCVVRWLRSRANTYGIDPTRIAVAGHSAGAHLAALLAVTPGAGRLDGPCSVPSSISVAVDGVVGFSTPTDLRVTNWFSAAAIAKITKLLGAPPQTSKDVTMASPRAHVRASSPPFFLVHATGDPVIRVNNSRAMDAALRLRGVSSSLIELPLSLHDLPILDTRPEYLNSSCGALDFLGTILSP